MLGVGGGVFRSLTCFLAVGGTVAQDLSIPTAWGSNSDSSDARSIREGYANDAAAALVLNLAPNGAFTSLAESQALAAFYTGLSMSDYLSGNQTWKDAVVSNMKTWTGQIDIYGNGTMDSKRTNSNGMQWALAAFYAYKAYGDQALLTLAKNAFDQTYNHDYILPAVAAAKQGGPGRNISFNASECFANAAGAIFWLPDEPGNTQVQADTVGPFAVLGGLLFEETGNTTYQELALQTVQYMSGPAFDSRPELDQEYGVYDLNLCLVNIGQSPALQGWYIHALSVVANQTTDSAVAAPLYKQLRVALSAGGNNTKYSKQDGILFDLDTHITSDAPVDKAILIRALAEASRRFSGATDVVNYSKALLSVQYNAILRNARSSSGNWYSSSLIGPPPSAFVPAGNIVAVEIFNAAFSIASEAAASNTTSPGAPGSAGQHSSSTSSSPVGAIVGGVVGGLAAIAAIAGFLFWRRRHRRRSDPMREPFDGDRMGGASEDGYPNVPHMVEPFTDAASAHSAPMRTTPGISELSSGHLTKLARMNEAPPSIPRGAAGPSSVTSDGPSGGGSDQQDIPALVNRLVGDLLREHGSVPPSYEEQ